MDLKEEEILGDRIAEHWYYRAKANAMLRVSGDDLRHVADVGAGSGFFSRILLSRGADRATLIDPGYPEDRDETHEGKPLRFRRHGDASDASLVLMMDVLEHVEDDVGLAREYISSARPGTRFIITVPAFQWLWSGHDEFLEHFRRYDLRQISDVLTRAGLRVDGGRYLYGLLMPLVMASRLPQRLLGRKSEPKSQMREFGPVMNTAFAAVCAAEAVLPWNRAAGLTAMVWGTVPENRAEPA
ncbi:class I SAM-dependent methyltransferase [Muricoccus pecuniae]|uniref:SAM-dependent methyltransferase n=1 Tax=Muricoccus pecuniae TaxID=693023 RepID=A0A840YHH2_9PROT|nr:methyltransferase domain-containing protein [Roseomonas pecuniae]MBB5693403.1 SAM-dependent methyltransferase [Roseomonas pecuniae]